MLFKPQINLLIRINSSKRLKFITRKPYGLCIFFKVLNYEFNDYEVGFSDIHNSLINVRPTLQSITTYIKACENELYEIGNSNIKKNKKVIKVHKLARKEFKEIFNIYLDELKLDENTTNDFLKL